MKNIVSRLIKSIQIRTYNMFFKRIEERKKFEGYIERLPKIENKVFSKGEIKIIFFVINLGMWKYDELFRLLLRDDRFSPYICSFLYPHDPNDYQESMQTEMEGYFNKQGFPFIKMHDFNTDVWFDINSFQPDIVFYAQPYNVGYDQYKIEALWDRSLFAYIPYCVLMEDYKPFNNLLLYNIAWRLFYPTVFHKEYDSKRNFNKGVNIIVSGYPTIEKLLKSDKCDSTLWKNRNDKVKRIIWAPHHSINGEDNLNYSSFIDICDEMLNYAKRNKDIIQIAFKPHPRLRTKLENKWGKEKTDSYYKEWSTMENTVLVEGAYVDLFLSSDALIHDCSTFMVEYLCTRKPLFFVAKSKVKGLNKFGSECMALHYKGKGMKEIEDFIENVVISGNDIMQSKRVEFCANYLRTEGGFSNTIYNEFRNALL